LQGAHQVALKTKKIGLLDLIQLYLQLSLCNLLILRSEVFVMDSLFSISFCAKKWKKERKIIRKERYIFILGNFRKSKIKNLAVLKDIKKSNDSIESGALY
jgi:hypothetical protein